MNEIMKGQLLLILGELWDKAEIAGIEMNDGLQYEPEAHLAVPGSANLAGRTQGINARKSGPRTEGDLACLNF